MPLSASIQTLMQKRNLNVALLVHFCFLTQSRRLWNGNYELVTLDEHHWFGLRKLGAIEGLEDAGALESAELRFSVSGVDSRFLALFTMAAEESKAEYINRIVWVYRQHFDDDFQCVDNPQAIAAGIMGNIEVSSRPIIDGGKQYTQRVIGITAQNLFYGRGHPPSSFYTPRDQDLRSPGDRGCGHIHELVETNIETPW